MKIKKSIIALLVSTLTCSAAISALLLSKVNKKEISKEVDPAPFVINESVEARDDVFGGGEESLYAGEIGQKQTLMPRKLNGGPGDLSLTKPKIGYQFAFVDSDSNGTPDQISIRFMAAINSLSVDAATWTRAMFKANGDVYPNLTEANKGVTKAYTGLTNNSVVTYATSIEDVFGNRPFNYFVVYSLLNIPLDGYGKYYLDASLTLTKGENSITSTVGAIEVDTKDFFTYEKGTNSDLIFTEKGDKKLSVKGRDKDNLQHNELVIPGYFNNGNGRYKVDEIEEEAFKDFEGLDYLEIPDVDYMGAGIANGSNVMLLLRSNSGKQNNNANWNSEWNNGHNKVAYDYIGYHGEKNGIIYSISKNENKLYSSAIGYTNDISNDSTIESFNHVPTTTISDYCFYGCNALESITIPSSVKRIGNGAFRYTSLQNCSGGVNVEEIGDHAFDGLNSLGNVDFGPSLITIGDYAFNNCYELTGITFDVIESIGSYAFNFCNHLGVIYLPSSLITIKSNAFSYTEATFLCEPETKPVGWNDDFPGRSGSPNYCGVIWNCKKDMNYNHTENGVTYIISETNDGSKRAIIVNGHEATGDVIIPEVIDGATVTSIKGGAFSGSSMTSLVLPDTVTIAGEQAFASCHNLESIDLGGLFELPKAAFYYTPSLKTIVWSDNLTTIGTECFIDSGIKEIILPNTVTRIEWLAFNNATSLETLYIPSSVTEIWNNMFSTGFDGANYSKLRIYCELETKPEGWCDDWNNGLPTFWGGSERDDLLVFEDFKYYIEDNYACIFSYLGEESSVVIPEELNEKPVVCVSDYCFYGCNALESITIPSSVKRIGNGAFRYTSLQNCSGGVNVEEIGDHAFDGLNSLGNVDFGPSLITIGDYAFNNCYELTGITFDVIESIGSYAFNFCNHLGVIYLPSSLITIKSNAFSYTEATFLCEPETKPVGWNDDFPGRSGSPNYCGVIWNCKKDMNYNHTENGVTYIISETNDGSKRAIIVNGHEATGDVIIPEVIDGATVTSIKGGAFSGSSMTSLVLPDTVTIAGEQAFASCHNLESIDLGGLFELPKAAFYYTPSLKTIVWSDNLTTIGTECFIDSGIKEIILPNTVTRIEWLAFNNATSLETLYIPSSVTEIWNNMFSTGFDGANYSKLRIYCELETKPEGWCDDWNNGLPTFWGCSIVDGEIVIPN